MFAVPAVPDRMGREKVRQRGVDSGKWTVSQIESGELFSMIAKSNFRRDPSEVAFFENIPLLTDLKY